MSFLSYRCVVKESAGTNPLMAQWVNKTVAVLPDSRKFSSSVGDWIFLVLPMNITGEKNPSLRICSKHLEPVTPAAKKLFGNLRR